MNKHLPPDRVMYHLERAYRQITYPRLLDERQREIRRIRFPDYNIHPAQYEH